MKKAYMVFYTGQYGRKPSKYHETLQSAITEATRLANERNEKVTDLESSGFLILEVLGVVKKRKGKVFLEDAKE